MVYIAKVDDIIPSFVIEICHPTATLGHTKYKPCPLAHSHSHGALSPTKNRLRCHIVFFPPPNSLQLWIPCSLRHQIYALASTGVVDVTPLLGLKFIFLFSVSQKNYPQLFWLLTRQTEQLPETSASPPSALVYLRSFRLHWIWLKIFCVLKVGKQIKISGILNQLGVGLQLSTVAAKPVIERASDRPIIMLSNRPSCSEHASWFRFPKRFTEIPHTFTPDLG